MRLRPRGGVAQSPAQRARLNGKPPVLPEHLHCPLAAEAKRGERKKDRCISEVVMERKKAALRFAPAFKCGSGKKPPVQKSHGRRQRQNGVLGRTYESAAQISGQPFHAASERAPTNPAVALEDQHVMALSRQLARRGEPCKAGTDHDNVDNPPRLCHVL